MIRCEISQQVVELAPGKTIQLQLTVINESLIIDQLALSLEPAPGPDSNLLKSDWFNFSPPDFNLRPPQQNENESRQFVQITITLPTDALAGNYPGLIQLKSTNQPDNNQTLPFTLIISAIVDQTLEIEPDERSSRRRQEIFQLRLANRGNETQLYPLYAEDNEGACRFEFRPAEVSLEADKRAVITLIVRPRHRNWASEDKTYDFKVLLEGFSEEVVGRFIQRCALPPLYWLQRQWPKVVAIAAILLALLVGAIIFFLPGQISAASSCGPVSTRQVRLVSNGSQTNIFISEQGGSEPKILAATENASILPGLFASLVSISADGRRLVYVTATNEALEGAKLWLVKLDSLPANVSTPPTPVKLIDLEKGLWPVAPVWSADGKHLAYLTRSDITPSPTKAPTPLATSAPITATTPTATPDPTATSNLAIWVVDQLHETPTAPRLLDPSSKYQLPLAWFYGDNTRVLCWSIDNSKLLFGPKTSPATPKTELDPKDGSIKTATATPPPIVANLLSTTAPTIPNSVATGAETTAKSPNCAVDKPFSQHDPRWNNDLLKPNEASRIAEFGCPLVAAAMWINLLKQNNEKSETTPTSLVACLGSASPLGIQGWKDLGLKCTKDKLELTRSKFSWAELNKMLGQKAPALVGLIGGQTGSHFVLVTGGANDLAANYRVVDPWDGSTYKTLRYFLDNGYQLGWLIMADKAINSSDCSAVEDVTPPAIKMEQVEDGGLYLDKTKTFTIRVNNSATTIVTPTLQYWSKLNNSPPDLTTKLPINEAYPALNEGYYYIKLETSNTGSSHKSTVSYFSFTIDRTPPEELNWRMINTAPDKDNNYPPTVIFKLESRDKLSGLAFLEFNDNRKGVWESYNSDTTSNPNLLDFAKNGNGKYQIDYRALDGAGNVISKSQVISVVIPIKPPASVPSATPTPGSGSTGPGVAVGVGGPSGKPGAGSNGNTNSSGSGGGKTNPTPTKIIAVAETSRTVVQPPPSPTPSPTSVAVVPPTPVPPTTTPRLNPQLYLANTQLLFDPATEVQVLQLTNRGNVPVSWSIAPNPEVEKLVSFSVPGGTLDSGANLDLTLRLKTLNLENRSRSVSFQFNSNSTIPVPNVTLTISPQPLPSAVFSEPSGGASDAPTLTVKLAVNIPGLAKPDHAIITATYKSALTNLPKDELINPRLRAADNWAFVWSTSEVPPQTSVSLRGLLCLDAEEKICRPIQALSGLSFTLSAAFASPTNNQIFTDTIPINLDLATLSPRANHVVLSYDVVDDLGTRRFITLTQQLNAANNWGTLQSTTSITPTTATKPRQFQITGLVCSSQDDKACQKINPVVGGLKTKMQATITSGQNFDINKQLPATLNLTITNPSRNINHISLYAAYSDALPVASSPPFLWLSSQTVRRSAAGVLPTALSWNTLGIPPQDKVKLEVRACFTADEDDPTLCDRLALYDDLTIGNSGPYSMLPSTTQVQAAPVRSYYSFFGVLIRDVNGYKVTKGTVNFKADIAWGGAGGTFFNGTATLSRAIDKGAANVFNYNFRANSAVGLHSVTATMSGVGPNNNDLTSRFLFYNTSLYTASSNADGISSYPFPWSYSSSYSSPVISTIVETNFTSGIIAYLYSHTSAAHGDVSAKFYAPPDDSGPSAIFTSDNKRAKIVNNIHANFTSTVYTDNIKIPFGIKANLKAGDYKIMVVSDDKIPGSSLYYKPGYFNLRNNTGPAAKLTPTEGSNNQQAVINSRFAKRLRLLLTDRWDNPVPSQSVSFSAPASGASGTFDRNISTVSVLTDEVGAAVAPVFSANSIVGAYIVSAKIANLTFNFNLNNLEAS